MGKAIYELAAISRALPVSKASKSTSFSSLEVRRRNISFYLSEEALATCNIILPASLISSGVISKYEFSFSMSFSILYLSLIGISIIVRQLSKAATAFETNIDICYHAIWNMNTLVIRLHSRH